MAQVISKSILSGLDRSGPLCKLLIKKFYSYPTANNHHAFETGLAYHTDYGAFSEAIADVYPQLNKSLLRE